MTNGIRANGFSDMASPVTGFPTTPYPSTPPFHNPNLYYSYPYTTPPPTPPLQYTPPPTPPYLFHFVEPPHQVYTTTYTPFVPFTPMLISDVTKGYLHHLDDKVTQLDARLAQISRLIAEKNGVANLPNGVEENSDETEEGSSRPDEKSPMVFDESPESLSMSSAKEFEEKGHQMEDKLTEMIQNLEKMGKIYTDMPKLFEKKWVGNVDREGGEDSQSRELSTNQVNQSSNTPTPVLVVDSLADLCKVEKLVNDGSEDRKQLKVSKPEIYAPHMFDEIPEKLYGVQIPTSVIFHVESTGRDFTPLLCNKHGKNDKEMVYNLHENEYGKSFGKFGVNVKNNVNGTQVFEGFSDKDRVDLVMPLFELVRKYGNMGGSEYRGNMQIRALVVWNTMMHLYVKSGNVVHGFATYCEQILKMSIHEFFPGEQNCDMLTKEWYIYRKLDVTRLLFDVRMWYRCWSKDNKMICHRLHEDELGKLLDGSRKSELDHELLDKSIQLKVAVKYSSGTGHMKCVYLDPMPSLFYEVYAACNMREQTTVSKTMQMYHFISWNGLMAGHMLYKQSDMSITFWNKMQHATNSDQMKDSIKEKVESAFTTNYLLERYMKRQEIFSCLTHYIEDNVRVCTTCSFACQDDHGVVDLWMNRNLRCNRGKSKFGVFFYLIFPSRDFDNFENLFNHNFSSRDCTCMGLYPGVDVKGTVEMIQCCLCEELLSQEHIDFESADEIFRDKELVYKLFIGKDSEIKSVKRDTMEGTVASHGFSQVMYVMFKEIKNAVITLGDITNWCILSSCAREGLAKEGWCFFEVFVKDGLYLNIDISVIVINQPVFIVDLLVVNQNAKNLFYFDWAMAKRVMKIIAAKTKYKITGINEKICKNTPEHLSKQVLEKMYLRSGNVEMLEGQGEVYPGGTEKLETEFSIYESLNKLFQVLLDTSISVEAVKVNESAIPILLSNLVMMESSGVRMHSAYPGAEFYDHFWTPNYGEVQVLNVVVNLIIKTCTFEDENWRLKFGFTSAQKNHYTKSLQLASPINVFRGKVIASKIRHPSNNDTTQRSPVAISFVSTICCAIWETILTGQILKSDVTLETSSSCDGLTFVKSVPIPQWRHCKKSRDRISDMSWKFLKLMNTIGTLGAWTVQNRGKLMKGSLYISSLRTRMI